MKHVVPIAFLVGAVSGAVGGGVTTLLVGGSGSEPAPGASLVASAGEGELVERVGLLQDELDALRERLAFVEQRPAAAQPTRQPVADDAPELAAVSSELRDLATALRSPDSGYIPPNFQETVGRALDNIREQEDRERDEQRAAARAEMMERRLQEMSQELGLAPYQVDGMRKAYGELEGKMAAAREAMEAGGDWGSARETFRQIRDETEKTISSVLSPDQYEKYQEMDDRGWRGFGGPGGGDRRGGRGGGGN